MHYESLEKVINLLDDCSSMVSEAKYKSIHGEELKTLTYKQMLLKLPIGLAQVKAGSTSEKF